MQRTGELGQGGKSFRVMQGLTWASDLSSRKEKWGKGVPSCPLSCLQHHCNTTQHLTLRNMLTTLLTGSWSGIDGASTLAARPLYMIKRSLVAPDRSAAHTYTHIHTHTHTHTHTYSYNALFALTFPMTRGRWRDR
jgi:hypothetical protein